MLQDIRYHKYIVHCVVSLLGYGSRIITVSYLLESSSEQIGVPRDGLQHQRSVRRDSMLGELSYTNRTPALGPDRDDGL